MRRQRMKHYQLHAQRRSRPHGYRDYIPRSGNSAPRPQPSSCRRHQGTGSCPRLGHLRPKSRPAPQLCLPKTGGSHRRPYQEWRWSALPRSFHLTMPPALQSRPCFRPRSEMLRRRWQWRHLRPRLGMMPAKQGWHQRPGRADRCTRG